MLIYPGSLWGSHGAKHHTLAVQIDSVETVYKEECVTYTYILGKYENLKATERVSEFERRFLIIPNYKWTVTNSNTERVGIWINTKRGYFATIFQQSGTTAFNSLSLTGHGEVMHIVPGDELFYNYGLFSSKKA